MTRTMVDCIGNNVIAVHEKLPNIAIVGCYETGTSDVQWNASEKSLWGEHTIVVSIDQGYHSPRITIPIVRDVEPDAWDPVAAVNRATWSKTVARPTIYCDRSDLALILSAGWDGDLWLAIPGWKSGDALPEVGSCTVVAVQNAQNVDNLYDSSVVLDQWWPERKPEMTTNQTGWKHCSKCQVLFFGSKESDSACPRGGTHDGAGSFTYTLTAEE